MFQKYFVDEDFYHIARQFAHIVGQNQLAFVADNVAGHINKRAAEALFLDLQFQIVFGVEFGDGTQRLFQIVRNFQRVAFDVQIFQACLHFFGHGFELFEFCRNIGANLRKGQVEAVAVFEDFFVAVPEDIVRRQQLLGNVFALLWRDLGENFMQVLLPKHV